MTVKRAENNNRKQLIKGFVLATLVSAFTAFLIHYLGLIGK
jgi:hypothetical protein